MVCCCVHMIVCGSAVLYATDRQSDGLTSVLSAILVMSRYTVADIIA
jgi:hypothetical protein